MNSFDVRVHALAIRKDRPKPYTVRWAVARQQFRKAFLTRALADNFRSDLMQAARKGESFDTETGLPGSMLPTARTVTWYEHACNYSAMKWPGAAAKTRISTADALATITPVLIDEGGARRPAGETLRAALMGWAFNPSRVGVAKPADIAQALTWLEANSLPLNAFNDVVRRPVLTRQALDACATRMDGKPAASTTARRKRAVFYNAMGHAVELGELTGNPVESVQWKAPKVADEVDRRAVASPEQVRQLLIATSYIGRTVGPRLVAFFALMYFAALRPAEALALRESDCELPEQGWGQLLLARSEPEIGKAWTDDGRRSESRSLKWRSQKDIRAVPIPTELVSILRNHIDAYGVRSGGQMFRTAPGGKYTPAAYSRAWEKARSYALVPQVVGSPLAQRPYDLRHGGVTLWLNSGVPAPEVARRAGHSVDVLLKIYAGCIDGESGSANQRIADALGDQDG